MEGLVMQIPSLRAVMSVDEYDRERTRLNVAYGDPGAGDDVPVAKRDQAFAVLFYSSGWTREQLAEREGKSHSWIGYTLCFGRFLAYVMNSTTVEVSPVSQLTERRFRSYWDRTDRGPDESARFDEVVRLMQSPDKPSTAPRSPRERKSPQLEKALDVVRPAVAAGEPVSREEMAEASGVSSATIQRAQHFEEGRQEGLRENLEQRVVDATVLSKTAQAKMDAYKKRLDDNMVAAVEIQTRAGIARHIDEHLMPFYRERLAEADLLMKLGKPLTNKEYLSILRALHPDSSSVEYRHDAFLLVKSRQVVLRPDERDRPLSSGLPTSLAELIARKDAIKAMAKAARAARPTQS